MGEDHVRHRVVQFPQRSEQGGVVDGFRWRNLDLRRGALLRSEVGRVEPGRVIHRHLSAKTAIAQIGPIADLTVADAHQIGETVKVIGGPLSDFTGSISDINVDQSRLKVLVSIFGRETPVELSFNQVAKL